MRARSAALAIAWGLAWAGSGAARAAPAVQLAKIVAPQRVAGDRFGTSLAAEGVRGAVGSASATVGVFPGAGRVHALARDAEGWRVSADLEAKDGVVDRALGASAAISGDFIVFGATGDYVAPYFPGALYTYHEDGGWIFELQIPAPVPSADERFGFAVATNGVHVLASRYLSDPAGLGRVYSWRRDAPAVFTQQSDLAASDAAPGDAFGAALALFGDEILVGARGVDQGRGAAYLFKWTGSSWTESAKLVPAVRVAGDLYGSAVALGAEVALLGGPGVNGFGGVAAFRREGEEWVEEAALASDTPEPGAVFGARLALAEPYLVVTALDQGLDAGMPGLGGRGRGEWFGRLAAEWVRLGSIQAAEGIPGDRLGFSLALVEGEALLGAPGDDDQLGAVYVFRLAQAEGEPCVVDDDCDALFCCDQVCVAQEGCSATSGEPTGTSGQTSGASTGGTTTGAPMLDVDPLTPSGCACEGGAPGGSAGLVLLALASRRRRRRG